MPIPIIPNTSTNASLQPKELPSDKLLQFNLTRDGPFSDVIVRFPWTGKEGILGSQ